MKPILTSEASRALDAAAQAGGIPASLLMARAGHALARAALSLAGGRYGRRVTVVCGGGNNGGDGYVAARLLRSWGVAVTVISVGAPATREPAASARRALEATGVTISAFTPEALASALGRSDAAVDALVGTGFGGPAREDLAAAISGLDSDTCPVLAADVPSGLGAEEGPVVHADATVTFGTLKPELIGASDITGPVEVADIGIPADLVSDDLGLIESTDVASLLPLRSFDANKRSSGVLVVVGGSRRMPGSVAMAATAALRAGAGLVQIAVPEGIVEVVQRLVPEATFLPMSETPSGGIADGDDAFADALARADAVVLGPGLGLDPSTAAWLRSTVDRLPLPAVLDADALNAFVGADLRAGQAGLVLTPHAGEFARIAGRVSGTSTLARVTSARDLSARTGAVVLLKGPGTVVARPDGIARINPTGGPSLATAGTGDVLAGAIGAFIARGCAPADAAIAAAFVHGLAGDRAAAADGEGVIARDVLDELAGAIEEVRAA